MDTREPVYTIPHTRRVRPELPAGTRVAYYPLAANDQVAQMSPEGRVETKTRSEPWQLGHGAWVVLIEGRSGGVAIEHIEVLGEAAP